MAYDEKLALRMRKVFARRRGVEEKKMFGGLCFLSGGNMICGIVGDELMVRVGAEGYDDAMARPHVREMDFTGRAMKGMVYVAKPGFAREAQLRAWMERGLDHARSLPPKQAKPAARRGRTVAAKKKAACK